MQDKDFSYRITPITHTVEFNSLDIDTQYNFLRAVDNAKTFGDLDEKWQSLILSIEETPEYSLNFIEELSIKFDEIDRILNGGKGSGNFGHSGRVGKRGGSSNKNNGPIKDSLGRELTPEQQEYFKNTKVLDKDGNLLVCYHGSPSTDIDEFKLDIAGSNTRSGEKGIFFTDSKEIADEFSYERIPTESIFVDKKGKKGKVYEGYVNVTNPLDLGSANPNELWNFANSLGKLDGKENFVKDVQNLQKIGNDQIIKSKIDIEKVSQSDFDGIIAKMEVNKDDREFIVFRSEQFKTLDNKNPTKSPKINNSFDVKCLIDKFGYIEVLLNGGKGSGNFGHRGRIGQRGGSAKTGSIIYEKPEKYTKEAIAKAATSKLAGQLNHKDLAFVFNASRRGRNIPLDIINKQPSIKEAKKRAKFDKDTLTEYPEGQSPERDNLRRTLENQLLDNKHNGSFMGKDSEGREMFNGEVAKNKEAFIVIGRPAGGKSRVFANPLSREHKARIMDSDMVKGWLPEFDEGFGAGRVHEESSMIMERALDKAVDRGENIVIPKIGGSSVLKMAKDLKDKGYKVNLYYNEISEESSITRAASRFAEEGRYLDPSYLGSIGNKAHDTFTQYANDKNYFDYAEWKNNDVLYGKEPKLIWKTGDDSKKLK